MRLPDQLLRGEQLTNFPQGAVSTSLSKHECCYSLSLSMGVRWSET